MYEDEIAAQLQEATWMAGEDFASIASVVPGGGDRPLDAFSRIFEDNTWCGTESRSGGGSSLGATRAIRAALSSVMQRYGIRSVLDAPCGDLNWIATLLPEIEDYTGADVVPQLVEANRARYGSSRVRFFQRDLSIDPLPSADLILCRDCLVHLPTRLAMNALRNMARTSSRYLLTTTFPDTPVNRDILTGAWRPLNLQRAPFHFGEPLEWLPESADRAGGPFADKALAMWALDDVRAILRGVVHEE
jgi:SAM-dependent methyltransferase